MRKITPLLFALLLALMPSLSMADKSASPIGIFSNYGALGSGRYGGYGVTITRSHTTLAGQFRYSGQANWFYPETGIGDIEQVVYNKSTNSISFIARITPKHIIKFTGTFSEEGLTGIVSWYQAEKYSESSKEESAQWEGIQLKRILLKQ